MIQFFALFGLRFKYFQPNWNEMESPKMNHLRNEIISINKEYLTCIFSSRVVFLINLLVQQSDRHCIWWAVDAQFSKGNEIITAFNLTSQILKPDSQSLDMAHGSNFVDSWFGGANWRYKLNCEVDDPRNCPWVDSW